MTNYFMFDGAKPTLSGHGDMCEDFVTRDVYKRASYNNNILGYFLPKILHEIIHDAKIFPKMAIA